MLFNGSKQLHQVTVYEWLTVNTKEVIDLTSEDNEEVKRDEVNHCNISHEERHTYEHIEDIVVVGDCAQDFGDICEKCTCFGVCNTLCINYMLGFECDDINCSIGPGCGNRWREISKPCLLVYDTFKKGKGVKTLEPIRSGQFVIEYIGEYMSLKNCRARYEGFNDGKTYVLMSAKGYVIDARRKGNIARFINHACDANLIAQKRVIKGITHVFLFAIRNIAAGEEIHFNYGEITFTCSCSLCE